MEEKKILHLVLYSPEPLYNAMAVETMKYYKSFDDKVTTIYYYSDPHISETSLINNILIIKGPEKSILDTTLKAMSFFDPNMYSFLIRSTVSTIINFNLLPPPSQSEYSGFRIEMSDDWFPYIHGSCIIFDSPTWLWIINNLDKFPKYMADDIAFGMILRLHRPDILPSQISEELEESFNKTINCDKTIIYINHICEANRKYDLNNVKEICFTLLQRSQIKGKKLLSIKYGSYEKNYIDLTEKIRILTSLNGSFTSDVDDNKALDCLSGDPAPFIRKTLLLTFEDNTTFSQAGIFTFSEDLTLIT